MKNNKTPDNKKKRGRIGKRGRTGRKRRGRTPLRIIVIVMVKRSKHAENNKTMTN